MSDKNTQIIEAAIRLFSAEGVSVPTAKIAKEAGVSNGTLFNYFATKQDLIDGVYFFIKEKMANDVMTDVDIESEARQLFYAIWKNYVLWATTHTMEHQVIGLLRLSNELSDDVKQAVDHFFVIVHEAMAKGVKDKVFIDMPPALLGSFAAGYMNALIDYVSANKVSKAKLAQYIDTSYDMYWKAITA